MIKALFAKKRKPGRYDIDLPEANETKSFQNAAVYGNNLEIFTMPNAGVSVTEQTAMQVSAVYACVSLIGGAISSMPLPVYQRTADGREKVDSDIWWLLNEQPNPMYSAATFWEAMIGSLLLHGDAFARIIRSGPLYKIVGFEWIHSARVTVRASSDGLIYVVQPNVFPFTPENQATYAAADMIHIAG
ncbi:MAG: phage portal protein, partial [Methylobacter tundripaludum]|nr:phage portal protein [Methylobacter tundripaludum]